MKGQGHHWRRVNLAQPTPEEEIEMICAGLERLRARLGDLDERLRFCGMWLTAQVGAFLAEQDVIPWPHG